MSVKISQLYSPARNIGPMVNIGSPHDQDKLAFYRYFPPTDVADGSCYIEEVFDKILPDHPRLQSVGLSVFISVHPKPRRSKSWISSICASTVGSTYDHGLRTSITISGHGRTQRHVQNSSCDALRLKSAVSLQLDPLGQAQIRSATAIIPLSGFSEPIEFGA